MSLLRLSVLLSAIFMVFMNLIGTAYIGTPVGVLSDRYPTRTLAAGYAFAIWGIIFLGTLGYAIYQVGGWGDNQQLLNRLAPYTIVAFIATGVWIPVFQLERFSLSVVIMLVILGSLAGAYGIISQAEQGQPLVGAEFWLIKGSLSIFLGWITAATVLNFSQTLMALGWAGLGIGDVTWAVTMLLIAGLIAALVAYFGGGNFFYAGTLTWALLAVAAKQEDVRIIVFTAFGVSAFILAAALLSRLQLSV